MLHGLPRGQTLEVIVAQQLIQKVEPFRRHQMLVLRIGEQVLGAEHLRDAHELIIVVVSVEERFLAEDHRREHTAQRPHIERVVVHLVVDQQLRSLEVAARDPHVVLLARMVELGQTPVDQTQLAILMVDHHVVWLHVTVHDAQAVAVVERLQQLVQIVPNVVIAERLVELLEVGIVHMLEDECRRTGDRILHHRQQRDDVGAAPEILEDLDFARKIKHLHEFLAALAQVRLGDERPLRDLFESIPDRLEVLFRDLDLCNKMDAGVNDLLDEYNQYEIASMELAAEPAQDEPMEEQCLLYSSEEESEATQPIPVKQNRLKIVELQSTPPNDNEDEVLEASDDNQEKHVASSAKSDGKVNLKRNHLQCPLCPYKTIFTVAYSVHMKKHEQNEGKTGYVCNNPYCLQMFDTTDELKLHKRTNPHKVYVCEICGNELKHRVSLEVHLERHFGITHFQCTYCSSSFHTKTEQQNHIAAIHISEERAECHLCGATFTSNKLLKQHMDSHVSDRNYHCVECKKSFKSQHLLNRHLKSVHSDVRFQCEHCEISYSRRDKLRMHMEKAHHIQTYFMCDICVRSFDSRDALEEHSFRHKHPNHLECPICLIVCLTQRDFDKHTCITYQENYICCGHDYKHHTVYNKHMLRHGIKVNARVKPNTNILIGQERALRTATERNGPLKYSLKSEETETSDSVFEARTFRTEGGTSPGVFTRWLGFRRRSMLPFGPNTSWNTSSERCLFSERSSINGGGDELSDPCRACPTPLCGCMAFADLETTIRNFWCVSASAGTVLPPSTSSSMANDCLVKSASASALAYRSTLPRG
uniref:C2H2-type domain-containing protein n=1 Tax=Anopheles culicifacies TaxID=139723 RepID=A0A182MKF9_9DIPT